MKTLFEKLNYKRQNRIAIINAGKYFILESFKELKDIQIDNEIDLRYAYGFMIIFVKKISQIDEITHVALHNLTADGILWFCFPKKSSKRYKSDIDRDHGWETLHDLNFFGIRIVAIDDDWSAIRFRNKKYIKAASSSLALKKV